MMKHFLPFVMSLLLLSGLMSACTGHKTSPREDGQDSLSDTVAAQRDTTIYGVATEDFGMSTFSLLPEGASEALALTRDHSDGSSAIICGDLTPDHRYAITTCDGGEALLRAINLTQLGRHVKTYAISNARLILEGDTVEIATLSDDSLVVVGADGQRRIVAPRV